MFVLAYIGKSKPLRRSPCLEKHVRRCRAEFQCISLWQKLLNILAKKCLGSLDNTSFWLEFPKLGAWLSWQTPGNNMTQETRFECRSLLCRLLGIYMWKWSVRKVRPGVQIKAQCCWPFNVDLLSNQLAPHRYIFWNTSILPWQNSYWVFFLQRDFLGL